ncbi:hypothetical protein QNA08_02365 [Chelatococcus sp. SYSU_G07232]|uniref:Uncharacterized protein n=1 Tax=Chelatococcus albus TaxID=3047466 RepID=A0ABT7ACI6_9HYPH|nr:hypothetical protein [Chelatococcus sp. SYSU_G07232]MDJ1157081.1 hypothetical protein [Chelatococcus sp. SYSU_G07232]
MPWIFAASSVAGLVLGCLYRAPALLAAMIAAAMLTIGIGMASSWPFRLTALAALGALACLQISYLVGLAVSTLVHRARRGTRPEAGLTLGQDRHHP